MADSTAAIPGLVLQNNWGGFPMKPDTNPQDMTSASVGHNAVAAKYQVGTTWTLPAIGNAASVGVGYWYGGSTFIYLKTSSEFSDATIPGVRTTPCIPLGTLAVTMGPEEMYIVCSDADQSTIDYTGLVAICTSTMTNNYYGWFWCGGVVPIGYVPSLVTADTVPGTAAITAGKSVMIGSTSAGGFGFTTATAGNPIVGQALIAFTS